MKAYDQIIYDELIAGRPVLLTDIGFLKVEIRPAEMKSDKTLRAPRKAVAYSSETPENAQNVVDILSSTGVDNQSAWDQYNAWLAQSRKDGNLTINGVGRIDSDYRFTPTAEFDKALNPNTPETVVLKPRRRNGWVWIPVILLLLLLGFLGFRYCRGGGACKVKTAEPAVTETPAVKPIPEETTPATGIPDAADGQQSQTSGSGLGFPVEGMHYVVGGVFDIPANADKYITYIKRVYPQLTPEKFSYPGVRQGRTMVTVFASAKRSETLNIRRQLAWNYDLHDYWLFPEEK